MNTIILFGITFHLDPVAFTLPLLNWKIYWYGIIIALGVLLALWYGMKNGERLGMNPDHIFNAFVVTLPCCILGARAYYIIFDSGLAGFKHFFTGGGQGFAGLAIYGGIIMAAVCILVFWRVYKFSVPAALDITALGLLIGQGIGRWGNFVNQEAYGTFTGSSFFGMTGNRIAEEMGSTALVHPCFLYESVWCIAGFFVLHHFSKKRVFRGQIALMYGVWYGFERCLVELLRTDSLMWGPIRVSSLLSGVVCVGSAVALWVLLKKRKESAQVYVPQFAAEEPGTAESTPQADPAVGLAEPADSTANSTNPADPTRPASLTKTAPRREENELKPEKAKTEPAENKLDPAKNGPEPEISANPAENKSKPEAPAEPAENGLDPAKNEPGPTPESAATVQDTENQNGGSQPCKS